MNLVKGKSTIKYEVGKTYLDETTKKMYVIISCVSLSYLGGTGYYVTAKELE